MRTRSKKLLQLFAKPVAGFVIIMSVLSPFGPLTVHAQTSPSMTRGACTQNGGEFLGTGTVGPCKLPNPPSSIQSELSKISGVSPQCATSYASGSTSGCSPEMISSIQTYLSSSKSVQAGAERVAGVTPTPSPAKDDIGCLSGAGTVTNTIALCLTNVIYVVTVGIGSAFAYVSAMFFNFAVAISLNGFSYALQFINGGWTVARDIANLFFILILVFIAFTVMLNAETAGTMRLLVGVIFIALIINFSFFITRVVIDVSNIFAIQFYNAIEADPLSKSLANVTNPTATGVIGSLAASGTGLAKSDAKDLTASIMNVLQVQNLFSTDSFQKYMQGKPNGLTTFITLTFIYVAAAILLWMLTIAFVVNGVKFLMRVVVLWLVIIASPLAFIAATLPQTRSWFNKWRDILVSYSLYPIVFMFIFLILTVVLKQLGNCPPVGGAGVAPSGCLVGDIFTSINSLSTGGANPNFFVWLGAVIANIAIRLGFIISLLYIGMKVADSVGVMGAEFAQSIGNKIGNGGLLRAYNVAWKRGGPGMWAGAADRALQKSRIGNNLFGYELRRYVTKPLAGTTIPGSHGESFIQMKERQRKEGGEKAGNLLDIKSQESIENLATFEKANPALDQQYKNLQRFAELQNKALTGTLPVAEAMEFSALSALVPPTPDGRDKLNKLKAEKERLLDNVKNFGKTELSSLKGPEITAILKYLSENQLKSIKESDKFSEQQKKDWELQWHKESPDSSISKANKQITLLRDIDTKLGSLPGVATIISKGVKVNQGSINTLKASFETHLKKVEEKLQDARDKKDKAGFATAQAERRIVLEGQAGIKELESRVKEIRPGLEDANSNAQTLTAK